MFLCQSRLPLYHRAYYLVNKEKSRIEQYILKVGGDGNGEARWMGWVSLSAEEPSPLFKETRDILRILLRTCFEVFFLYFVCNSKYKAEGIWSVHVLCLREWVPLKRHQGRHTTYTHGIAIATAIADDDEHLTRLQNRTAQCHSPDIQLLGLAKICLCPLSAAQQEVAQRKYMPRYLDCL